MEDMQDIDFALSSVPSPDTPEALQAPTRQVSPGFMFALTAAAISLYILYAGIGALLLPYQIGLLAPGNKVAILSFFTGITVLIALFANPLAGAFSDRTTSRFGRRRPWIIAGGLLTVVGLLFMWQIIIMAISFLLLAFLQTWVAVLVAAAVLGFGLGAYLAVDVAIVTLVLPSAKNRAKDMGIINIANTLPHSVAPVFAGFILALTHSYSFLYIAATIFVLLGILTVLPIKAVR